MAATSSRFDHGFNVRLKRRAPTYWGAAFFVRNGSPEFRGHIDSIEPELTFSFRGILSFLIRAKCADLKVGRPTDTAVAVVYLDFRARHDYRQFFECRYLSAAAE